MYSPPAYPTLAPLDGSTTGDPGPTCGVVPARGEDVSDPPSKGLLPQLIDVLHALTEGQELLSRRVREARLDHNGDSGPVVERCGQAEPSDAGSPPSFVGSNPNASIEIRQERTSNTAELVAGPISPNDSGNGSSPEPSISAYAASVSAPVLEAAAPSSPPPAMTDVGTPADLSSEPSDPTDRIDSAPPVETTTASLNRDYNFFDELDSRLADLQDAPDGSGD